MAMFDYVEGFECKCPQCGATVDEFQTKQLECLMESVDFVFVDYFYTHCEVCQAWITVEIKEETAKKFFEWRKTLTKDDYEVSAISLENRRKKYE